MANGTVGSEKRSFRGVLSFAKVSARSSDTRDYTPDYINRSDETLLVDAGFKQSVFDTWGKAGNDGRWYSAYIEPNAENYRWYYDRPLGGINNYTDSTNNWMTRETFISLFR